MALLHVMAHWRFCILFLQQRRGLAMTMKSEDRTSAELAIRTLQCIVLQDR